MPFDINIMCLSQKKQTSIPFSSTFYAKAMHTSKKSFPKAYHSKWYFMSSCYGFLYQLVPSDKKYGEQFCGAYDMCNDIYCATLSKKNEFLPDILMKYTSTKLHQIFSIKKIFLSDFCKVIDFYINESPVKMIVFLARCGNQCEEEELDLVTGVITRKQFIDMLMQHKIVFNMCYIIRSDCVGPVFCPDL